MRIATMKAFARDNSRPFFPAGARCALAICLLVAVALLVGGCKYSDVLTGHVEDPECEVVDETADPIYIEQWGAPEDPTRKSTLLFDTDRIDEQVAANPLFGEAANDQGTNKTENAPDTPQSDAAVKGTESSEEPGASSETRTGGQGAGESSTEGGESDEAESDESGEGHENTGGDTGNAGAGGATIVNADGTFVELPENVSTVAAAGQYATIVQMLSGKGPLIAADQSWKDRVASAGAFPGEGVEEAAAVWSDGADASTLNMDALIACAPDAILVDNAVSCMSDEQAARAVEAGISVVYVPALGKPSTQDADVTRAVQTVGELLKNAPASNGPSSDKASTYVADYHDKVLSACEGYNGGPSFKMYDSHGYTSYYQGEGEGIPFTSGGGSSPSITAVIDSWTAPDNSSPIAKRDFYSSNPLPLDGVALDASDGVGIAAKGTGSFMLIDYYLQLAGVVNNAYPFAKPAAVSESSLGSLVIAGESNGLFSRDFTIRDRPSALWYKDDNSLGGTLLTVGDTSFPGVLVRDSSMAAHLDASAGKANGLYNVGKQYRAWTIPSGLAGSWLDGTVESYLASPWAASVFRQDKSDIWDYYLDAVSNFYSTFYRCSPDGVAPTYADRTGMPVG